MKRDFSVIESDIQVRQRSIFYNISMLSTKYPTTRTKSIKCNKMKNSFFLEAPPKSDERGDEKQRVSDPRESVTKFYF